jgi:DNA-binding GntR family transcriptional regulator
MTLMALSPVAEKILHFLQESHADLGTHLSAQKLANQFKLSRSPITEGLAQLHTQGWLKREHNRGYFLAKKLPVQKITQKKSAASNRLDQIYLTIADDRLRGRLANTVSEASLREAYQLSHAELQKLLTRMVSEGWLEKKPGYGWTFSNMLTTPESLQQSYRLRLALEPAALLEPGYHLAPDVLAACKAAEQALLDGGITSATAEQLHERGVRFHESLVGASNNPFFIEPLKRVNRVRRLLSYRSTQNRDRFEEHAKQHLQILNLLEQGKNAAASVALKKHLERTLKNLEKISPLLSP